MLPHDSYRSKSLSSKDWFTHTLAHEIESVPYAANIETPLAISPNVGWKLLILAFAKLDVHLLEFHSIDKS